MCLFLSENACTFALFFMVLDLRLVKIGCRETINFFVPTHPVSILGCTKSTGKSGKYMIVGRSRHKRVASLLLHCIFFLEINLTRLPLICCRNAAQWAALTFRALPFRGLRWSVCIN